MSKVLFLNGNMHGHINPTLPVVRELVKLGEEVYYFSTIDFKQQIEDSGARFMDYGLDLTIFFQNYRPCGNHPFYSLIDFMLAMDRVVIPIVLKYTNNIKFDYIIHDAMFGGGNILANKLHIPAISTCSSFVMEQLPIPSRMMEPGFHSQLNDFYLKFEEAKKEWGLEKYNVSDLFFKKEALNLVFTSKLFQPMGDSFDESFRFIGPSIADRKEKPDFFLKQTDEKKLIYISMGTIYNQCIDFYNKCIEAFRNENVQVVMSVGSKTDISLLNKIPDHFIVRNYIPQLEVLKSADVFLCHGGLNSVSEALYYAVPVIAIPLANDQPMVAARLVELGAGMELKMAEVTPELLNSTVHMVLAEHSYKTNSMKIKESFILSGGYRLGAQIIMNYRIK